MVVVIIALAIFFVVCIRIIFLDFIDLLIGYKEYKEAEKIALESLETSHEVDKIFMKMENDFEKFKIWALSNGYDYNEPKGQCTIDRINPNGNYEPYNCRFITLKENDSRVIRYAKKYTYNGETHTLKEWAKIKKWSVDCLYGRLHRGMSFEEAITTPFDNKHKIKEDKSE